MAGPKSCDGGLSRLPSEAGRGQVYHALGKSQRRVGELAVSTVDKAILIISVTAIIIVLTYIFRVGWLFRPKQSGPGAD